MTEIAPKTIPTPPPEAESSLRSSFTSFDILRTYQDLLSNDPLLTSPIAAIESLINLLSTTPPSTVSETLSLLSTASAHLKANIPNPLPITAGTDLFQRYIISTLQSRSSSSRQKSSSSGDSGDFRAVRAHLLANSRLFVQRAKEARGVIAWKSGGFIRDGVTVVTFGTSRVVNAVLEKAADDKKRFRVVYVEASSSVQSLVSQRSKVELVKTLRHKAIPVAVIPFESLATAILRATFVILGAESVVENGGVVSQLGTYQMGLLAQSTGKPLYVVAESYKFVRVYPLDERDVRIRGQGELDFRTEDDERPEEGPDGELVDFTPPELITALVTEAGVQTPSAVSEELIKIWD